MKTKKRILVVFILLAVLALAGTGILLLVNTNWGFARNISDEEKALRLHVVETAEGWLGAKEEDESHTRIIDIYNQHTPLAQNYQVKYTDKWCATFVSTVAIQCELTNLIPTECGCQRQIGLLEAMGCWEEDDRYTPLPGDIIFYSSDGASSGENTGWSDHVGIVCGTWSNWIKVIEGNVSDRVAVRYISRGDRDIRGYGVPDYASACE